VIFAFPTNDELLAIFVGAPIAELARSARGHRGSHPCDRRPGARAGRSRAAGRARGAPARRDAAAELRPQALCPGWALVGDAGCHKDPYLALGICDALRDAELLADALHEGLSGELEMDEALAGYERRRDEATIPEFRRNLAMAHLEPPPAEVYALRAAVRGDEAAIRRFYLVDEGMIDRPASSRFSAT
jgi:flavin-dependent dehydrogenase